MSDLWSISAIVVAMVALFIWDRLPVIVVCIGAALALYASGILTLQESLAGFGDPAVIFVASLFVVSAGLEMAGITAWAGQILIARAGNSRARLLIWTMGFSGVLSALITLNGAVAALLPVVVVMAIRLGRSPAQLLLPLVYGGHAGSQLLLTGTPVSVLIAEASAEAGAGGFGYFAFALVGVPLLAGSIAIAVLFGKRLLPTRTSRNLPPDLSYHANTLIEQYRLQGGVHRLRVRAGSTLVGRPAALLALDMPGIGLLRVTRQDSAEDQLGEIEPGDHLVVQGEAEAAAQCATAFGLGFNEPEPDQVAAALFNRNSGLAEVVIPPRSALIGERIFPGMVTPSGDLIVLAVQRRGEELAAGTALAAGDSVLLQGTWRALEDRLAVPEVLLVNSPDLVRRQAVPMGLGARQMLAILGAMVVLLATGLVPAAVAGLLAAGAVLLCGILSVEQVYRAVNWTTVILIGALMPLSLAMERTGAARLLAEALVETLGALGPHALQAGLFVLTAVLGQVISNTATAMILIPISVVAAGQMGLSPQPILMGVGIAAAAAFLTPVSTATNLMVMEPGGYRFGDYWKFGLPLMIWFFLIAVFLVPVIWPF
ncbi:MAG: SLC13 family permease [Amaricoccus sp.]